MATLYGSEKSQFKLGEMADAEEALVQHRYIYIYIYIYIYT